MEMDDRNNTQSSLGGGETTKTGSSDGLSALGGGKKDEVVLEWRDVNMTILEKNSEKSAFLKPAMERKPILANVSGVARSGQLLAIMGPTGCGKTSLLNVLAGRVPQSGMSAAQLSGDILVNGKPRDDQMFRRISAYVLQDDRLYPHLTVHETLSLASHFFLPTSLSDEKKGELVDAIILELNLATARDTIIGDEKVRGVSGGERKRANIAVQLISNPKILFMDEPTSGLDSFQAQSVMQVRVHVYVCVNESVHCEFVSAYLPPYP